MTQPIATRPYRTVPYDLVRELALALAGVLILVVILAGVLSSPDVPAETIQSWAKNQPVDLVTTATQELSGDTVSSNYGPPYNSGDGSVQSLGFVSPQSWLGVHVPVDSGHDFVLAPLTSAAASAPELRSALDTYTHADPKQQAAWADAYVKALKDAKPDSDGNVNVTGSEYGPLPVMMASLLAIARSGGLDGYLVTSDNSFYATDYTKPLLFMGDGGYVASLAEDQHLLGDQWGMMNETGSYPGQTWLWLYTFWYQVWPFAGSSNADLGVVVMMTVLSLGLLLVPFIPGLRDIPRWIPIYRLIWRNYYRTEGGAQRARA